MRNNRAKKKLLSRLIGGVLFLSVCNGAQALGLGKFTLQSRLNEPLRAEIELTAANPHELKTLRTGLAPFPDFERAGVDYAPHLFGIKFTVATRADGQYVVQLTSDQPVREPFLHLLVQADWAGGHLIREYTALLDPPGYAASPAPDLTAPQTESLPPVATETEPAPLAAPPPEAVTIAPSDPTPVAEEAPVQDTQATTETEFALLGPPLADDFLADAEDAAKEAAPTPAAEPKAVEYGPVKRGETLLGIVKGLNVNPDLSSEQAMLAILKANPAAFRKGNVNHLRRGVILKVPDADVMAETPQAQASRQIRAQYDAWQEYKLKLAAVASTAKETAQPNNVARGEIKSAGEAKPAPKSATAAAPGGGEQDLLKIVRAHLDESPSKEAAAAKQAPGGESAAGSAGGTQVLRDKVSALEEALESREMENKELRERISLLEAQVKNAQRLMEIESKAGAVAQNQAAQPAATPAPPPAPAAQAEAAPKPAPAPATPPAPQAAKPPVAKAPPAPEPEVGLLDQVLNSSLFYPVAGGLAVLVLGAGAVYMRRRRRSLAEFEESILAGGGVNSENQSEGATNPAEVSVLSNFSLAGMGNMHTDEVDPIAEAEVYLAYGRDEQAEEILKEAVVKDAARHELRLKLMEIYQQRKDLASFETVAEELYAALEGKGGKVWEKAEEMGRKMNPQNPLFAGRAAKAAAGAVAAATTASMMETASAGGDMEDSVFDLDLNAQASVSPSYAQPESVADQSLDFAPSSSATSSDEISFDLDLNSTAASEASAPSLNEGLEAPNAGQAAAPAEKAEAGGLEFDLADLTVSPTESATDDQTPSLEGAEVGEIEWNFDTSAGGNADSGEAMVAEVDLSSDDGETLGDDGAELLDEASTKLDLAKAYIDMGDTDGARSILDEVLAEGNAAQKQQAQELYTQIQ